MTRGGPPIISVPAAGRWPSTSRSMSSSSGLSWIWSAWAVPRVERTSQDERMRRAAGVNLNAAIFSGRREPEWELRHRLLPREAAGEDQPGLWASSSALSRVVLAGPMASRPTGSPGPAEACKTRCGTSTETLVDALSGMASSSRRPSGVARTGTSRPIRTEWSPRPRHGDLPAAPPSITRGARSRSRSRTLVNRLSTSSRIRNSKLAHRRPR